MNGELDRILLLHRNGEIKPLLSQYDSIGLYPARHADGRSMQIVYQYHNLCVTLDFLEDGYTLVIYPAGTPIAVLEALSVQCAYPEDFSLQLLVAEIDGKLKSHPALLDMTQAKKQKKLYALLARIFFWIPFLFFGPIALYCVVSGEAVQLNAWWWLCFLVIPLIAHCVFDYKALKADRHL